MSTTVLLETNKNQLHHLATEAGKSRGQWSKVDKEALAALVSDHGRMVRALGNQVKEPVE